MTVVMTSITDAAHVMVVPYRWRTVVLITEDLRAILAELGIHHGLNLANSATRSRNVLSTPS
jgi:hypothetical protein